MISLSSGQEMKIAVNSVDPSIVSKNKTIRYIDPAAVKSVDANLTSLARDLFKNSQNTYKFTKGTIELGIFNES